MALYKGKQIAAATITQTNMANDSIGSDQIIADAVGTSEIAASAVTSTELATDAVTNTKIATGAVDTDELAADSVTNAKIAANAVNSTELATDAVTTAKITNLAVTTAKIDADAVDGTKIGDDVIDSEHYVAASIDGEHLSANAKTSVMESRWFAFLKSVGGFTSASATTDDVTKEVVDASVSKETDGSASADGVIVSSPDNKVFIREDVNNDAIKDANGHQVFGRITKTETALTGTLTFTNGSTTVTGSGTIFLTELAAGDFIELDADGIASEISSVSADNNLTLVSAYTGTGGEGSGSQVEITLSYFVDASGTETAHTMAGETIDFQFPESQTLNDAPLSGLVTGIGFSDSVDEAHNHDDRYFTETELGDTSATDGASLIGYDSSSNAQTAATNVADALDDLGTAIDNAGGTPTTDQFAGEAVTAGNPFVETLSATPTDVTTVIMEVNGAVQRYGATEDFTISGTTVTWESSADFNIEASDEVTFHYEA